MTGSQLKSWRMRLKMKIGEAAEKVGVSVPTYNRLERRDDVGLTIALACAAINHGLPPAEG